MLGKIRTQAVLLSAVPLCALLVILLLATALAQKTRETTYWASHSDAVLNVSDTLMQRLNAANRRAVQYSQTRDNYSRIRYAAHIRAASTLARKLETLVADNAAQEERARRFTASIAAAEHLLDRYVRAVQARDRRALSAIDADPATRRLAGELAASKQSFDSHERELAILRFNDFGGQLKAFSRWLIAALLAGIGLTLASSLYFAVRIVNRLNHLGDNARRLGAGEIPIPLSGNDEIADLDRQYREMATQMRHERHVASTLQRALLPQTLPSVAGLRIDSAYMPAADGEQVGGDWYDVFHVSDDVYGLSIGDVAGHGLRAARVMAVLRQSIRTAAQITKDPCEVLAAANRLLCDDAEDTIATAFFALLDVRDGTLRYSLAGHPPPLVMRAGGIVSLLEGSGIILGFDRSERFQLFETTLPADSALVLYTDGLIELHGDYEAGMQSLFEAAIAAHDGGPENVAAAIQRQIFQDAAPRDDSAVLFIGVAGSQTATALSKSWTVDAKSEEQARRVRREVLEYIAARLDAGDYDGPAIELIVGELLGNVARHTPGHADVHVVLESDCVTLHVEDRGAPFVPRGLHAPEELAEGGRGLFLVTALSRTTHVERLENGNRVSAVLPCYGAGEDAAGLIAAARRR